MKGILNRIAGLALLITACQQVELPVEQEHVSGPEFTAQAETFSAQTKTTMDGNTVVWNSGDQIAIFQGLSTADKYQVKENGIGRTSATFEIIAKGNGSNATDLPANVAIYPYESRLICRPVTTENGTVTSYQIDGVTIPPTQTYTTGSFADESFPMAAITTAPDDHTLNFKNLCGVLKLQLKGTAKVKSIELKGNDNEPLSGEATVTIYPGEATPIVAMSSDASQTVILDCGEGVQLSEEAATDFLITIPPTGFNKGFSVIITDTDGGGTELNTSKPNAVKRSYVHTMPEVDIEMEKHFVAECILTKDDFVNGTYSGDQLTTAQKNRIRTELISARAGDVCSISLSEGWTGYIGIQNSPSYTVATTWINSVEYEFGYDCNFIVVLRKDDNSNISPADYDSEVRFIKYSQYPDAVKDYFWEEIELTKATVMSYMDEPCLVFPMVTDIHYMNSSERPTSINNCANNIKELSRHINFDFIACLGDIVEGNTTQDVTSSHVAHVLSQFEKIGVPYYPCIGNHDDNRYKATFTHSQLYSNYLPLTKDVVFDGSETMCNTNFYKDFDELGLRCIFLNANNNGAYGYSAETCDWFEQVVADSRHQFIVFTHISPVAEQNYGQKYGIDSGSKRISTICETSEKFIIMFSGHNHYDASFTDPFLSVTVNCQKFENENGDPALWAEGAVKPSRTVGDATEDCFDVVVIRPGSKKINKVRFGAGNDEEYTWGKDITQTHHVNSPYDFSGKKAFFFGDSITYGYIKNADGTASRAAKGGYPGFFSEAVGLTHTNYGVSGSLFGTYNDLGRIGDKIKSRSLDCDFIFVAGGINDWQCGVSLSDFREAVEEVCSYIDSNFDGEVIFITPINHSGRKPLVEPVAQVQEYREIITETALSHDFSVVQGGLFGFPTTDSPEAEKTLMFCDNLHPTEYGYEYYANCLIEVLGEKRRRNSTVYRAPLFTKSKLHFEY